MNIFINDEDFECDAMFYRQPFRDLIRRRDDEVVLDELRISLAATRWSRDRSNQGEPYKILLLL